MLKNITLILCIFMAAASVVANNRFPLPSLQSTEEESKTITELGKSEVLSQSFFDLTSFLWDRYMLGPGNDFEYGGCNPNTLTPEQAKLPATILLHSSESNQGQWVPLIDAINEHNKITQRCGPVFTFNFQQETDLSQLINKIERVREIYFEAGQPHVELNLVGHSLGAITSAEYAFNPDLWVNDTTVKKVISIAGRLKNIEPPIITPFYSYCYDVLERVENIWHSIERNRGIVELFTVAAANDWLVPLEAVLVGDDDNHRLIVLNQGHVLISRSPITAEKVIQWLSR